MPPDEAAYAGRLNRIWDERAKIYADPLAAVNFRQIRRQAETQTGPVDEKSRQAAALLSAFQPPDWYLLGARSQALASDRRARLPSGDEGLA